MRTGLGSKVGMSALFPAGDGGGNFAAMGSAVGVPFHRVSVRLDEPSLDDVGAHTDRALASCGVTLEPGSEVAIALGSRGIVDLRLVVERVIEWARGQGARPFVVSAMGSHGGATAEGQREVLASYGLDAEGLGCPVRTSMDVVELPGEVGGVRVVTDAEASKASATIVVNRVKPHTDFHGPYESGLVKMIAIGLGNQVQAERIHAYGSAGLRSLVPEIGGQVLAHGNVVLGVAMVENALEQVMAVEAVPAAEIFEVEPDLLALARAHMPCLPIDDLDVLLVDQMGKDVSGVGMDTNVIGRTMILGEPDPETPRIRMIGCHRLTFASHGNACGMGLADVVPRAFADAIDHEVTRTNIVTSGFLLRGKLPLVADDDREVWDLCLRGAGVVDVGAVRAVRIVDTLHCAELWASDAVCRELASRDDVTIDPSALALHGEDGELRPFDAA
jgi:hypothetical protein